ncbi:MAG: hypothetical protein NZT61_03670 [Deltaproteobacteria bacterium]|nr:hypothetical protein [Deltaproteobacteria bacterium]
MWFFKDVSLFGGVAHFLILICAGIWLSSCVKTVSIKKNSQEKANVQTELKTATSGLKFGYVVAIESGVLPKLALIKCRDGSTRTVSLSYDVFFEIDSKSYVLVETPCPAAGLKLNLDSSQGEWLDIDVSELERN